MFESFFPKPKLLFSSAVLWVAFVVTIWYTVGADIGSALGFQFAEEGAAPIIGLGYFVTDEFLWFYLYYILICAAFSGFGFSTAHINGNYGHLLAQC